jgi:amidohydrolase
MAQPAMAEPVIHEIAERFRATSAEIHANPETAFREHRAAALLTDWLADEGFAVQRGVGGLDTAFVATSGPGVGAGASGGPVIALLAEYDALPGIGHGCGHNLIGAGAVLAASHLRRLIPDHTGTLALIGTPGEEGGGGKIKLLDAGVFEGIDAVLMFHPADRTLVMRRALAAAHVRVEFHGVAAHAAKNPADGRNALTAMIQLFDALDGLRQHMPDRARIHGVIREGGKAPNVIPDFTSAEFYVRDATTASTVDLLQRFEACASGAATATGTRYELTHTAPMYSERRNNVAMATTLARYLDAAGVAVDETREDNPAGSSDIGNVSLRTPTIHPYIQIAERGTPGHSAVFREAAATPHAHDMAERMALSLAAVAADLLAGGELLTDARREHASAAQPTVTSPTAPA